MQIWSKPSSIETIWDTQRGLPWPAPLERSVVCGSAAEWPHGLSELSEDVPWAGEGEKNKSSFFPKEEEGTKECICEIPAAQTFLKVLVM